MRRIILVLVFGSYASIGCRSSQDDAVETTESALTTGQSKGAFLTFLTYSETDEQKRQDDTRKYYMQVHVGFDGVTGGTIASDLGTLSAFQTHYGFGPGDVSSFYYNRGDLGIGREMHCVDHSSKIFDMQIACYVKNFAAGDDGSEFTFGLSSNIAFKNLEAGNAFATVAMVFRGFAAPGSKDRVFFAVYGPDGNLLPFAALDRHGINFANAFKSSPNPDPSFGVPGVTFNNHVPSNCVSCHGGQRYDQMTNSQKDALFLPFDLDQFDYENTAGRTRDLLASAFQVQNQMVRKVADFSQNAGGTAIKTQLDGWYRNGTFDSTFVPAGWSANQTAINVYRSVVRRSCRTCHISNAKGVTFDDESTFQQTAVATAGYLCGYQMPHSLQSLRQFWLSTAPADLESYFRAVGQTAAADQLHGCGPGDVATLDPPLVQAVAGALL